MDPGTLLREARKRHGLTQKQLAIRARTSQAAISRIERGLVSPTIEMLEKLLGMVNEELVLAAREIDWGHDPTLIHRNLSFDADQRLANAEAFADFVHELRGTQPHVAEPFMFRPRELLRVLIDHGVDFVVIGDVAGIARGSAYMTHDLDIAYSRAFDNLDRLAAALRELEARLRGAPEGIPSLLDAETLAAGAHFTFETNRGPLDILDRPDGSPAFDELRRRAGDPLIVGDLPVPVASLDDLIAMKEATGRPRDAVIASELRLLADEIRRREA